jgi:hypothetical protein
MTDAPTQPPPVAEPPTRPANPFDNERDRAITAARLATLDDTVSGEELMAQVEQAVRARLAAQ